MTKADLIREMAQRSGLTQRSSGKVLAAMQDAIKAVLGKGGKVVLVGFGTFTVARRAGHTGRHPKTGMAIKIPARKVPVFRAGKGLRKSM